MESTSRKWIEAGKVLAQDPMAQVPCPTCGAEFLEVVDHPWDQDPSLSDRQLRCPQCGATETLVRMRKGDIPQ
jgi:predicted RNA-binding Zn-ribbon protein involved in translation (DUF1610 family)